MYKVVYISNDFLSQTITELESKVNKLITQGWCPQGGICVRKNSSGRFLVCQVMTKTEKTK